MYLTIPIYLSVYLNVNLFAYICEIYLLVYFKYQSTYL
jgi:hypothetical protein